MTEQRPIQATPVGALRFNIDSAKLEYFDGNQYVNITTDSPEQHTGGTRGLFMGGGYPNCTNLVEFIQVNTTGNAADFGDLTAPTNRLINACFGSRTRGFAAGGGAPSPNAPTNVIQQHEFASTGNFNDFGNLSSNRNEVSSVSDATRAVISMANPSAGNAMEYITMASSGDSVDFGDRYNNAQIGSGTVQSPTRGVFISGYDPSGVNNIMDYLTFSTLGNTADFGDALTAVRYPASASNAVRGVQCQGGAPNTHVNTIEFITIATLGNAQDFGDLTMDDLGFGSGACSSPTRAVFSNSTEVHLDYVQIMTTGNSLDFGDKTDNDAGGGGASNGHGGLG